MQLDPARIFAALGDPNRLLLMVKLSDGESRSIIRLTADFPMSRQAITKHLRVLEQAGVVRSDRVGRETRFSYVPEPIEQARSYLDTVCEQWDDALVRLKAFVEN
jgi:DNA-binding transcriptional ArsR family regulator